MNTNMNTNIKDFDPYSYTITDIEKLLKLPNNYTSNDVSISQKTLIETLTKQKNTPLIDTSSISGFINKITDRLHSNLKLSESYKQNTINYGGSGIIIENNSAVNGRKSHGENGRIASESNCVPSGFINPINVRTITQVINIDSLFRTNYSSTKSTNYSVQLPHIQKNVVSMRITAVEIPTTYYAVSEYNKNNKIAFIDESYNAGYILTLPDGNYETSWSNNSHAADVFIAVNSAIANAKYVNYTPSNNTYTEISPAPSGTYLTDNSFNSIIKYSVSHVSGKSMFYIDSSVNNVQDINLNVFFGVNNTHLDEYADDAYLRLGWQLGYRNPFYTLYSYNPTIVSEGICLVSGPRYGFIAIDDFQKNTGPVFVSLFKDSVSQDNIITRINLSELQADVGVYQNSNDPGLSTQLNRTREYFGAVDIQKLHLTLLNEYGKIIDLNNMDWSITLAFEILYN